MRKILEFGFSLPLVAALWLWLFPMLGATNADAPVWLFSLIVIAHSALAVGLFQFFYGAELLIGARFNGTKVLAGLLAAQVIPPFVAAALLGLCVPGLVESFGMLAVAIPVGFVCQYVLLVVLGPLREWVDDRERMSHVTLRVWTHGAYIPVIRNGKLEDGELLIIEPEKLVATEHELTVAWNLGIVVGNWEEADRVMLQVIPRLSGGPGLRLLRLQSAIQVLAQSYEAAGNQTKAEEMAQRHSALSRIYREHGAL